MKNFIFVIFILVSCQSIKHTAEYYIPLKDDVDVIEDSFLLGDYKVIRPELTDKAMISHVDKILLFENKIGVLDKSLASLFIFDMNGTFLYDIHRIGSGPGEYIQLLDVCLDTINRSFLFVTTPAARLYYDYSGHFLEKEPLKDLSREVEIYDGLQYFKLGDEVNGEKLEYSLVGLDLDTNEESYLLEKGEFPVNGLWSDGKLFFKSKGLWFMQRFENILYKIEGMKCVPVYQFDLGRYSLPKSMLDREFSIDEFSEKCHKQDYVFSLTNLVDIKSGILMNSNLIGFFYYDKIQDEFNRYSHIWNRECGVRFTKMTPVEGEEKKVAFVLPDYSITLMKERLLNLPEEERNQMKITKLLAPLNEKESNPVIFLYDLK